MSYTISAKDSNNESVNRVLTLNIENTNQGPIIGEILENANYKQGQNFTKRMKQRAFIDYDLSDTNDEKLTFSISKFNNSDALPDWLSIDKHTGDITGRGEAQNVGTHGLTIRATDQSGLYAEQDLLIEIVNINDAPKATSKLKDFIEIQDIENAEGEGIIYMEENKVIKLNEWFDDADIMVDNNEKLKISVFLQTDEGDEIDLDKTSNENSIDWIKFDGNTDDLIIDPKEIDIGRHFIKVIATDRQGLNATAIVPILVRWKNRKPTLNLEGLVDYINKQNDSVESAYYDTDTDSLRIRMVENESIKIDLPGNIFNDEDIGINLEERIYVSQVNQEVTNDSGITFNNESGCSQEIPMD